MTEALIYLSISFLSVLLFAFWYSKQGKSTEKKWLMVQLAKVDESTQPTYLDALKQLEQQPSNTLRMSLLAAILIIPTTFLIDYVWFHDIPIEQRITAAEAQATNQDIPDLATAIKQLEQKLNENPEDLQGQMLYGKTMMSIRDYDKAVQAYLKANEIEPNNAHILTELAEAIAFRNNTGSFLGEPEQYLAQAMTIDPQNQKAMWLQGIVHYENQRYHEAETIWTELMDLVSDPNIKSTITKQINQARSALNKPPIASGEVTTNALFTVVVEAEESIKNMALVESARLFVFAKQAGGAPMPIAAATVSAPFQWPLTIELSDQNSLNPGLKLSQFDQVEISAKISLSGDASDSSSHIQADTKVVAKHNKKIQLTLKKSLSP